MIASCVAFDFDGTLVDSVSIKRQAFFDVTTGVTGAHPALTEILASRRSGTRTGIFRALAERLYSHTGDVEGIADEWIQDYTERCELAVVKAPEIEGARRCLQDLHRDAIPIYVNSATPEETLMRIIAKRDLAGYFRAIFGAPSGKAENLMKIISHAGCTADELVFVGDGLDDRDAARLVGCTFIAVGEDGVSDLLELPARIVRLKECT